MLPPLIEIHDVRLSAVQLQPAGAVTAICRSPPEPSSTNVSASIAYVHPVPCSICTVCPATVTVPTRGGPLVGSTWNLTLPLPRPSRADRMLIQGTFAAAVHAHCAALARTSIDQSPPLPSTTWCVEDSVNSHGLPSCEIETCWSLTVMFPVREEGSAFDVTVNWKDPSPWPSVGEASVIQAVSDFADHWHSRFVLTRTVADPPEKGNVALSGCAWIAHFTGVGAVLDCVVEDDPQAQRKLAAYAARIAAIAGRRPARVTIFTGILLRFAGQPELDDIIGPLPLMYDRVDMQYAALATDYDDTLACKGRVDRGTIDALERARAAGLRLLMVTGRVLPDLFATFPQYPLFHQIVGENGAVLYEPASGALRRLADAPPPALLDALAKADVPVFVGESIVATYEPYHDLVRGAIRNLALDWHVIFNKGSVMALPANVTKATGLAHALETLGLTSAEVVGIGDAENDEAFLQACGVGVAVSNALPSLKQLADFVTDGARGAGVTELIDRLISGDVGRPPNPSRLT